MGFFWSKGYTLNLLARLFELISYLIGSNAILARASVGKGTHFIILV